MRRSCASQMYSLLLGSVVSGRFVPLLANNGGPTLTIALKTNSPAINAGNNALASGLAFDQRGTGFPRIISGTVDIGAVESFFSVIVVTNAATHFLVSVPTSVRAGTPFNFTVSALDVSNTVVSGYRGTAHFTSTDGAASLPVNYTFVAGDNGVHTFTAGATLRTAGMQAITATDTVTAPLNGT